MIESDERIRRLKLLINFDRAVAKHGFKHHPKYFVIAIKFKFDNSILNIMMNIILNKDNNQ